MHQKHTHTNKKDSAVKVLANKCKAGISEDVAQKYGWFYAYDEESRNQWRTLLPFRADVEEFAVQRACFHLATLSGENANAHNPQFLKCVLEDIAKYLIRYSMKNPAYLTPETVEKPDDTPEVISHKRSARREMSRAHLLNMLLNQNMYYVKIKEKHTHTSNKTRSRKHTAEQVQQHNIAVAREKLKTKREINGVFREAAGYRKKK